MKIRSFVSVAMAAVMTASLAACGGSSASSTTAAAPAETKAAETTAAAAEKEAAPAASGEVLELRMANQQATDSVATQLDKKMIERIEKETDGRIKITLYADSALGDYTNVFDELMVGTIDCAHISPVETYDSRVSATMLPYLASSYDELLKAYSEGSFLREELNSALDGVGIQLLGIFCEGFNGIGAMKPLENITEPGADKGLIIRSPMMDVYALCLQDMGFRTSSMPYSDTYTAMQTGVVDGFAGGTAQINYLSFRDIIKEFYDYRYIQEATMIMFSQETWKKISPEDQEIIKGIVVDICEEAADMAESFNDEMMEKMKGEGINVTKFSEEELAAFAESCRANVWPQLAKNYPEGWLEKIEESLK